MAKEVTFGFALSHRFLHDKIFNKYEDMYTVQKAKAYTYYKKYIFKPTYEDKIKNLESINLKRSDNH